MRQGKKVSARRKGLTVAFVLLFIFSSGMLIHDFVRSAREQAANEALVQRVEQEVSLGEGTSETSNGNSTSAQASEQERNYQPLIQENSHLAAWLMIEGSEVDYPVLYTPEEPEHYLRRAFDGSYTLSGSLFIGANSSPDGSNIIIYRHNMNDDSMFGSLDSYADEDYAREHQEIIYDLIQTDGSYKRLTFEVMAAFYSRIYSVDEKNVFRYYYSTDLSDSDAFQYYIEEAMSASLYDLGVTAEYGDRLLTLSTCSYHTEDGRFVVVAREEHSSSSMQ